jgi:hypothetical protein
LALNHAVAFFAHLPKPIDSSSGGSLSGMVAGVDVGAATD